MKRSLKLVMKAGPETDAACLRTIVSATVFESVQKRLPQAVDFLTKADAGNLSFEILQKWLPSIP